jgi:hypothetical protein
MFEETLVEMSNEWRRGRRFYCIQDIWQVLYQKSSGYSAKRKIRRNISEMCYCASWEETSDTCKVKQSHYRPWQVLRVPGGWGSQILRQSAHESSKVVSPIHWPPLPQEIFLVLISVRGWVDPRARARPEGLWQWIHSNVWHVLTSKSVLLESLVHDHFPYNLSVICY